MPETKRQTWINGAMHDAADPVVSVDDSSLQYGLGLFETMRLYDGQPHMRDRHLRRLADSCAPLGLPPPNRSAICGAIGEVRQANAVTEGRLKVIHTASITAVLVQDLSPEESGQRSMSIRRATSPFCKGPVLPRPKSLNYLHELVERDRARADGFDEAIFCTHEGVTAEGTFTSVFIVSDGTLITPPLELGILPGVTRQRTLELARSLGIDVEETAFGWSALQQADEIFLTSSIREIRRVHRIGHREIDEGAEVDTITAELQRLYRSETPTPDL